jgi:hypothetical protein
MEASPTLMVSDLGRTCLALSLNHLVIASRSLITAVGAVVQGMTRWVRQVLLSDMLKTHHKDLAAPREMDTARREERGYPIDA